MATVDTILRVMEIDIDFEYDTMLIEIDFEVGNGDRLPNYEGAYTVVPKTKNQTLETKDKSMIDNVLVLKVPTEEISNDSGTTFIIAR